MHVMSTLENSSALRVSHQQPGFRVYVCIYQHPAAWVLYVHGMELTI